MSEFTGEVFSLFGGYNNAKELYEKSKGEDIVINEYCSIQRWYLGQLLNEHRAFVLRDCDIPPCTIILER